MNNFIISTDTSCDMPEEFWSSHEDILRCILPFSVKGVEYTDNDDLSYKDYYNFLAEGNLAKTSQINQYETGLIFDKILSEGNDIIHIGLSGGVSSSHDNFRPTVQALLEKYPDRKIEIIDSASGSGGLGILVNECYKSRQDGKNFEKTTQYIHSIVQNICSMFIVEDLNHLRNGGRISRLEASIGTLLGIRPILKINELGEIFVAGKARGFKKASMFMYNTVVDELNQKVCDYLVITHGDAEEKALDLGKKLEDSTGVKVLYSPLDKVIGAHTGNGTLAVFYAANSRKQEH